jgi:predicted ATPase/DNA-binding SARP family transcriptional activator/Tfp pilus assembly protein PilF
MTSLTLTLLGGFQAVANGQTLRFPTDKIRALLAYLAIEQGRPHRREALAALLWPDLPDRQARGNLRLSLHRLRQTLDKASTNLSDSLLTITRTTVQWQPDAAEVDHTQLLQTLTAVAAHDHPQPESCPICLPQLETAAALLTGDLLAGFAIDDSLPFEEWLLVQREFIHQQGLRLFGMLAAAHEQQGRYDTAYDYARRQLALEPWYEAAHRQAMLALARQGDRDRALAQFAACRDILWQELGVEPAPETAVLAQQIRDGDISARPAAAPLRHFPTFLTPFIGRSAELGKIVAQLRQEDGRLLTLLGPGGVGKSRLAVQAAHHLAAQTTDLEGIYFVPLATVAETPLALTAIASALEITLEPENPRRQLLAALGGRRLLLLLDNLEHLPGIANLLGDMLAAAPGVQMLATSREPLHLRGEQLLPLAGLAYPRDGDADPLQFDAVKLFVQSARQMRPDFTMNETDVTAVTRLCQLVDGLPLALELAAAWVRLLDCPAILRETERSLAFLDAPWRDAPARHQSLQAVFSQTWSMLPAHLQQLLAQLAAFPTDFDLSAVQAIIPNISMLDVAALLDRSLLRRAAHNRYELHPLLKQFVAAQTVPTAGWREAFSRHYLQMAANLEVALYGPAPQSALSQLRRELPNLRRAWLWGIPPGLWPELAASLPTLARFYQLAGLFAEGVIDSEAILTQLPAAEAADPLRGQLHLEISHFLGQQGQYAAAVAQAKQALALAQQTGSRALLARSHGKLGEWLRHQGQYEAAQAELETAVSLFDGQSSPHLAAAYNEIGFTHLGRGRYGAARTVFQTALALYQELGDQSGTAVTLGNLGYVNQLQSEYAAAQDYLQQALTIAQAIDDRQSIVKHTLGLGQILLDLGDLEEARAYCRDALRQAEAISYLRGAVTARVRLADADLFQSKLDKADGDYRRALALAEQANLRDLVAHITGNLGIIQLRRGSYETAVGHYQTAIAICRDLNDPVNMSRHLGNLGTIYRRLGQYEESQRCLIEALSIFRSAGARLREANALTNLGFNSRRLAEFEKAHTYFSQALAIYTDLAHKSGVAHSLGSLGMIYEQQGEIEAALKHLDEALALSDALGDRLNGAVWRLNLAEIHLDQGDAAAAGPYIQAALQMLRQLDSKPYLANALLQEGRWLLAQGAPAPARLAVEEAVALAGAFGDKTLVARGEALLAQIG